MIAEAPTSGEVRVLATPIVANEPPDVRLRHVLEAIRRDLPTLRAVVVGDANGLPVASVGPRGDAVQYGLATTAMATLTLQGAEKVSSSLGLSRPDDVWIRAGTTFVIVRALGRGLSLCAVLAGEVNQGFVDLVLDRVAHEIVTILRDLL